LRRHTENCWFRRHDHVTYAQFNIQIKNGGGVGLCFLVYRRQEYL
jgi:hypothetical protein